MDFNGLVGSLKDKYEGFISKLEEKGVPHVRLLVPLVVILVLAGVGFLVLSSASVTSYNVKVIDLNTSTPISGANVSVFSNGVLTASDLTDSNGNVVFNLTSGGYTVSASSTNYASSSQIKLVAGAVVQLESLIPPSKSVVVSVEQNGQPVFLNQVTLSFSDGSSTGGTTDMNGNATIQVPANELNGGGTVSVNGNVIPVSSAELSNGLVIVNLTATSTPTALLYVAVVSASGQPVSGAQVSVLSSSTQSVLANGFADSTGSASFNVSLGSSIYVTASASGYGSGYSNSFVFNASQSVQVKISRVSTGSNLTLSVLDENSNLVSGAVVDVFTQGNNQVYTGTTSGTPLEIPLASGVFYANVQYNGYLPVIVDNLQAGMVRSVSLTPLTAGNYANVSVLVLQDGNALPGASVSFYTSDGLFLLNAQSDGNGMVQAALPMTLNSQPYSFYVSGSYNSFVGKSDVFQIGNDNISLPLSAPAAQLKVNLVDFASKAAVTGFVNVVVGGNIVNTCNGTSCVLNVPGGTPFNLNVQASGYLPFTSSVLTYSSGSLNTLSIPLYSLSLVKGAGASFVGLFDSNGNRVLQVVNGMTYTARFLVNMPVSTASSGFYVRVGEEGNSSTDPAYITGFTPASFIQTGSSYPQDCTAGDSPTSQAKWLLWTFPKGFVGSKEVDVQIHISLNASASTPIVLYYKAFGQLSNGLSVFSPVNTALTQENFSLSAACNSTDFSQTLPFSPNPLVCSVINNHEFCYSMSFSSNGVNSIKFNPVLGQQFKINLNVLSDIGINGLTLYAPGFKTSQSFSGRFKTVSFQSSDQTILQAQQALSASSTDLGSLLQTSNPGSAQTNGIQIPFTANANQLSTLSLTLTPITPTFYAPLSFNFQADDGSSLSFSQTLSVQGTGTLNVQVSPSSWTAPGSVKPKITITDAFGNPVSDVTVSLTECYGSPFNGNPPAVNNQGNGVYSFQSQLFGGGIVGVNAQDQGFQDYSSCNVDVQEQSFLSVSPSSLTFSGDSLNPISQQVTVQNLLNTPVKVSSIVNCYSGSSIFNAIPPYVTIPASGSNQINVNVIQNSSGSSQCVLDVVGVDGNSRDSEQVQLTGSVSCPECVLNQQIAYGLSNLPSTIALYPAGPQTVGQTVFGFNSIPVSFPQAPQCSLTLTQGQGAFGFAGSVYPGYAMTSSGSQFVQYGCQACTSNNDGSFNCQNCQSGFQSAFSCEVCQPSENTALSTYSNPGYLVLWPSASCSACVSGATAGMVASSTASTNGLISLPLAQQQFYGGMYGGGYGGYGYPGSMGFPGISGIMGGIGSPFGFGNSFGQGQASCTANQIQVSAPLNPQYPVSGVLTLTFSNGMTTQINVVGPAAGILGFRQITNSTPQQNCGVINNLNVYLDDNLKQTQPVSTPTPCNSKFIFNPVNIYLNNTQLQGSFGCTVNENNNQVVLSGCDFSNSAEVKNALPNNNWIVNNILNGTFNWGIANAHTNNSVSINFLSLATQANINLQVAFSDNPNLFYSNKASHCYNSTGSVLINYAFPAVSINRQIQITNLSGSTTFNFIPSTGMKQNDTASLPMTSLSANNNFMIYLVADGKNLTSLEFDITQPCTTTPPAPSGGTGGKTGGNSGKPSPAPTQSPLNYYDFAHVYEFFDLPPFNGQNGNSNVLFDVPPTTTQLSTFLLTPSAQIAVFIPKGMSNNGIQFFANGESSSINTNPVSTISLDSGGKLYFYQLSSLFNGKGSYNLVQKFKLEINQECYNFAGSEGLIDCNDNTLFSISPNEAGGEQNSATYSVCDTPTTHSIGNVWVFKVSNGKYSFNPTQPTVPNQPATAPFNVESFNIISTGQGSLITSTVQSLYVYVCENHDRGFNALFSTSNPNNYVFIQGISPLKYSSQNEYSYEYFRSVGSLTKLQNYNIFLKISNEELVSRYYCQSWPTSATDSCDGSGKSQPQVLSTS